MKIDDLIDELDASYEEIDTTVRSIIKSITAEGLRKWHEKLQKAFDYKYVINDAKDLYYCWMPYDSEYVKSKIKEVIKTSKSLVKNLRQIFPNEK